MIYREKPRTLPLLPLLGALFSAPLACAAPRVGSGDLREPTEVVTNVIDSAVARGEEVGFSYLVVRAAGPGFEVTRGRRDAAEPGEVGPETMFLSASMTKVVTAMAVLRLTRARSAWTTPCLVTCRTTPTERRLRSEVY